MLDDVRQRLLHEPVQRRLDLGREATVALKVGDELDRHAGLLREVVRQPLERGDEAEVVERRRAELDRETADVLERRADELPHLADGRLERRLVVHVLEAAQAEEDRRERLAGLVVQLAGEAAALELLRGHDSLQRVARHPLPQLDGDRGARREDLGEAEILVGEPRIGALLVVRRDHADRLVAHEERDVEGAARAEPPRRLLLDLGIVEDGVDALAPPPGEHAHRLRARRELEPGVLLGPVPRDRGHPQPVALRQRDRDEPRVDELAEPSGDELEERVEVELRDEDVHDLVERLELGRPARRGLVEARVLDRDRCLRGEELDGGLVVGVEVGAAGLLREIEVAVDRAAQPHGHAEEGVHRRMVRREADRARIVVRGRAGAAAPGRG